MARVTVNVVDSSNAVDRPGAPVIGRARMGHGVAPGEIIACGCKCPRRRDRVTVKCVARRLIRARARAMIGQHSQIERMLPEWQMPGERAF